MQVDWGDGNITAGALTYTDPNRRQVCRRSHSYATDGTYTITVRLIDDDGGVSNELTTVAYIGDILAPQVASVTIDDGSAQRSMIRSITVLFDSEIVFDEGAFDLRLTDGTLITVSTSVTAGTPTNEVVLTFPSYFGGSLEDGNYRLTLLHTHIRSLSGVPIDGDGDGAAGGNAVDQFFRLFGDGNGDGYTDFTDFANDFLPAFGSSYGQAGYRSAMDKDADGFVDFTDFAEGFLPNFGKSRF